MNITEAKVYQDDYVINGWMVSEKLNGVRAIWDGKVLLSKNGNKFNAPAWFLKGLPSNVVIEGELYIDKNMLGEIAGIVRKKIAIDEEWRKIKFMIFDAPNHLGAFKERIAYCKGVCFFNKFADVIHHEYIKDEIDLFTYYNDLVSAGAEGVIIRDPYMDYKIGRSSGYLKLKPKDDDEAKVIDYIISKRMFSKKIVGLLCKWKNKTITIPTIFKTNKDRIVPEIGETITFLYRSIGIDKLPVSPVYSIVRDYE